MQERTDPQRLTRLLAIATLAGGVLLAGCGGSSGTATTAAVAGGSAPASTVTAAGASATSTSSTQPDDVAAAGVAFARCMRANGVPNFPDPLPGRGLLFSSNGVDPNAPAVEAAHAKCQKLLPGGGPPGPGSTTHPSAQTIAKLVNIAACMRHHGVPDFPDPRTSVPLHPFPSGQGVITDYDGAILLFPSTLDMHSPAYERASGACGVLAGKLGRGPHS